MLISVKNAHANNLKNISVDIPIGKITALTGVSGSGKSTLLKEILGAYGAQNYTRIASKTVKDSLLIRNNIEVDAVENLPNTILIDVKSSVSNPMSTVSTVSGIHEILRNLFVDYGVIYCDECGSAVYRDYSLIRQLSVDLKIDDLFAPAIDFIESKGTVSRIEYFDKNGESTTNEKKKAFATVYFSFDNINEKLIREFNKQFSCSICVISEYSNITYDFLKEIECASCHVVGPNLIRSRASYNTSYGDGGGACRCCHGTGKTIAIKPEKVFLDNTKGILEGASDFITAKGIKYSTVTEKFIAALYEHLNLDIGTPICDLSSDEFHTIMYGMNKEITFRDRTGGKKTQVFEGIANYLNAGYRAHKGGDVLKTLFDDYICLDCGGSRFDRSISRFVFCGESISTLMAMTLNELGEWCKKIKKEAPIKSGKYLDRMIKETDNFRLLSCGHLKLSRASSTLSGGELQRIRICALLNADIHGLCYLLDEPSSGLHYSDIENLVVLLRRICERGNTIVMVEHNKKLLSCCNHIVDMGPCGGRKGGNVLFGAPLDEIKAHNTSTTKVLLTAGQETQTFEIETTEKKNFLEFNHLTYNNLKNVSVRLPKDAYTVVCGISGSGKSTFVRQAVYASVSADPSKYGFDGIDYLGQASKVTTNQSTVASLIKLCGYISKIYEKASKSKIKKNCFMLGSSDGKCQCCGGKGTLYSAEEELLGVCDQCGGYGFDEDVLKVQVDGLNIYEFYNTNLEDLGETVKDTKIKNLVKLGCKLGVGYLSFARQSKTLSKGELQRILLLQVLMGKEKNHLLILDEPSKGLHTVDAGDLISALREVTLAGNTVLAVEHNPEMIKNADYIIEFGGTGVSGGHLLFQGKPDEIKETPTAKMLEGFEVGKTTDMGYPEKEIIIEDGDDVLKFAPHHLYYDYEHLEVLVKAAKRSKEDFLSVAIPNNAMFSRLDRNMIESDTPIMLIIDFNEKIKYNISVGEALGISRFLDEEAASENEANIARYVFDSVSTTGKCTNCKGSGKVWAVNEDFFLQGGELNAVCKKFLKNSTDYLKLSKYLKKDKIDITKTVGGMTDDEKTALFWGTDKMYDIEGKSKRWEGIISYFIQYHSYYSDKNADTVFKKKTEIICPVCNGERLKQKYLGYRCCGLSFGEWMSLSADMLLEKLNTTKTDNISAIKERLLSVKKLGIGSVSLSSKLIALDEVAGAKIKLASFYFNRIYDAGIVVKNIAAIGQDDQITIKKILEELIETNTVWVV
ncbi:MAG: ATP-binding cassette domain-containing protein [Lachnospiraceae bacterium]|nr:ATP-binding cassette domain-containing protein [Lachnospiraceae bacterium]